MNTKIPTDILGEYLFKQWIMKPVSQFEKKNGISMIIENQLEFDRDIQRKITPSPKFFLSLLKDSVENSIAGRQKIGLFLSGGLDSGSIAVLAKRAGVEVIAGVFKYGQDAVDYDGISNDYGYAERLCKREGIKFLPVEVEGYGLKLFKEIIKFMDSPIADPAIIPSYLIAKKLAQESNLILSGHGGDELLGGYQTYQVAIKESVYGRFIPDFFLKILRSFAEHRQSNITNGKKIKFYRDLVRFADGSRYLFPFNHECYRSYFTVDEINRLVGDTEWLNIYFGKLMHYLNPAKRKATKLQVLQLLDFYGTLNSHNLAYTEYACKAANVEVKFPFLDRRIVKYCFNLPDSSKVNGKNFKVILRRAMSDILPYEILQRKRAGFAMPIRYWFSKNIDEIADIIKSSNSKIKRYLNPNEIDMIIDLHIRGKMDNSMKIWILLTLELFLEEKLR